MHASFLLAAASQVPAGGYASCEHRSATLRFYVLDGGNGFVWYDCIDDCRCKYGRIIDRTLIQTALASLANLDVTKIELRVNIAPQSSAHRTRAIAALCDELNRTNTIHSCRLWRGIGTNMISLLRY